MVSVLIRNTGTIIDHTEVRPAIRSPASFEFDMSINFHSVNCVVDEIRNDFSEQQRISANLDLIGRFLQRQLNLFGARSRPGHAQRPGDELVQINRLDRVAHPRRGSLRKSSQHRHSVVGSGSSRLYAFSVDGIQPSRIDLLQVTNSSRHVVAKVVHYSLARASVEQMTVSIRQLRLKHPPHPPPSDRVS